MYVAIHNGSVATYVATWTENLKLSTKVFKKSVTLLFNQNEVKTLARLSLLNVNIHST